MTGSGGFPKVTGVKGFDASFSLCSLFTGGQDDSAGSALKGLRGVASCKLLLRDKEVSCSERVVNVSLGKIGGAS